jgi:hypothetical protein
MLNEEDAKYNNIEIEKIIEILKKVVILRL